VSSLASAQELLYRHLADIINQEVVLPGVLLTVGFVDLSPNLERAKIGLSVLPEKFFGTALEAARAASSKIRTRLSKELDWRVMPRLIWLIDERPKRAGELESVFKAIEDGE